MGFFDNHNVNILVLSDAGKLIFHQYATGNDGENGNDDDNEEFLCYICGLVQAIRASTLNDESLSNGEIQSINANNSNIVFMTVGCITLVVMASKQLQCKNEDVLLDSSDAGGTIGPITTTSTTSSLSFYSEAYLKLQLEYVYSGIIFALTESIQHVLHENPTYDVREMLGSTNTMLKDVLSGLHVVGDQPCMVLGGVNVFGPVPSEIRHYTSKILCTICSRHKSIIYAMLSIDKKLFDIIQPHCHQYQLQSCDLNLLLYFITSQTTCPDNELWFPVCLPLLSQSGFVNGYQCSIQGMDELKLTIITQDPTIEEFKRIQCIAKEIQLKLGLLTFKDTKESILRVYHLEKQRIGNYHVINDDDIIWERTTIKRDYKATNGHANDIKEEVALSIQEKKIGFHLLRSIKKAMNVQYQNELMQSYCEIASAAHFVFRYVAPIRDFTSGSTNGGGSLSQCFSSSLMHIGGNNISSKQQYIWNAYEKLSLQLRFGSTSPIIGEQQEKKISTTVDGINEYRPSILLHERKSEINRIAYFVDDNELYFGRSGTNYELFVYFNTDITPFDADTLSTVLADTLINDVNDLLHCKPQSF